MSNRKHCGTRARLSRADPAKLVAGQNLALDLLIELQAEFERRGPALLQRGPRGGRAPHVKVCARYLRRARRAGVDVERSFAELLRILAERRQAVPQHQR